MCYVSNAMDGREDEEVRNICTESDEFENINNEYDKVENGEDSECEKEDGKCENSKAEK
jgi:hypothetical protein